MMGACAATKAATRAAQARSVPALGAIPNSLAAHRVQRRKEAQRVAPAAPTHRAVLVRARTWAGGSRWYAQSARAHAIALSEYRRLRATPRGTTTKTALQARQRYRRTWSSVASGAAPGVGGPSSPRSRRPCPTICRGRPGSRLATPQAGQRLGRTAPHEGRDCVQDLTSDSQ